MSLLRISEPGQSPEPHQGKLAVGIDLGTSNSLVCSVRRGGPAPIADGELGDLVPSVVHTTVPMQFRSAMPQLNTY